MSLATSKGSWNDNVLIAWESNKKLKTSFPISDEHTHKSAETTYLVPGKLKMFFQVEGNSTLYAVVHSCQFQSAKQSILSTIWMKEYKDIPETCFSQYKEMKTTKLMIGERPIYCVIDVSSVHAHCLLIPHHHNTCFFLLISNPNTWANEFHCIT